MARQRVVRGWWPMACAPNRGDSVHARTWCRCLVGARYRACVAGCSAWGVALRGWLGRPTARRVCRHWTHRWHGPARRRGERSQSPLPSRAPHAIANCVPGIGIDYGHCEKPLAPREARRQTVGRVSAVAPAPCPAHGPVTSNRNCHAHGRHTRAQRRTRHARGPSWPLNLRS